MDFLSDLRCRQVTEKDVVAASHLLARGFPSYPSPVFWASALNRLRERDIPDGCPRYGYVLEVNSTLVGIVLLICAETPDEPGRIRCNLSSWYVEPAYRMYAPLLVARALSRRGITYTNLTSAKHTRPMLLAQGFQKISRGQVVVPAVLLPTGFGMQVVAAAPELRPAADLSQGEVHLLIDHARSGCISLVCSTPRGREPFVFRRRRRSGIRAAIPFAHLLYCRSLESYRRCAGALGRYLLLRRRLPVTLMDSDEPIPGLPGIYFRPRPLFFKGPNRPRPGDLAYSELALFNI